MYNGTGKNVVAIHAKTLIFYVDGKGLQLCIADEIRLLGRTFGSTV